MMSRKSINRKNYLRSQSQGSYPRNDDDFITTVVYYETIKRDLNRRLIYECRCDERLKSKDEESTRLVYTEFHGGLEHRKC